MEKKITITESELTSLIKKAYYEAWRNAILGNTISQNFYCSESWPNSDALIKLKRLFQEP